jgi:drug/metabolite transporter (DMT)-like permease
MTSSPGLRLNNLPHKSLPKESLPHKSVRFKTYLLIFVMVIFGPLGNVLLGKGMKTIGAVSIGTRAEALDLFARGLTSGTLWLGIACLLIFFVANMLVLSWADYSYVQPASSVAYGMSALLAHFLLREVVTPTRWMGVLLICLGVLVVGHTPPRTTRRTTSRTTPRTNPRTTEAG